MHKITIAREMPQQPRVSVDDQIGYIVDVALRGTRGTSQGWKLTSKEKKEYRSGNNWVFVAQLQFKKTKGKTNPDIASRQWDKIVDMISKAGSSSKFNKYPWLIRDDVDLVGAQSSVLMERTANSSTSATVATAIDTPSDIKKEKFAPGVTTHVMPNRIATIPELRDMFPHELLQPADVSDPLIEEHPAFKGIYNRGPQIRTALSAIWTFIESNGEKASHILFWGLPACAKTAILLGLDKLFPNSVLKLDSTSTSRAGLERLVFKKKDEGGLEVFPPFVFMEEIEKANEETLRMWLGSMDDRKEFRKVMHHMIVVRQVKFLGMATANDKAKLDMMMGGRPNDPGALSSRFQHQLECWRPDERTMRRILLRDLPKINGREEWIDPCIELMKELKTDDPRRVLSFLDGRERLMNGEWKRDQIAMYKRQAVILD